MIKIPQKADDKYTNLKWTACTCKRYDCKYHMPKTATHGCNYVFVTGKTKLSQMNGKKYTVKNCPFYIDGRRARAIKTSPMVNANDEEVVHQSLTLVESPYTEKLYDSGLNDNDIAYLMDVSIRAVARWRKMERIGTQKNVNRYMDWDSMKRMLSEGYSAKATAKFFDVDPCVITLLKEKKRK